MLDRIEVNVIDVSLKICLVADRVLPETALPKSQFAISVPRDRRARLDNGVTESTFNQIPTIGKIGITVRQCHDDVEMVGEHYYCIDREGMLPSRAYHCHSQRHDMIRQDARRSIHKCCGEEESSTRKKIPPVMNHP